MEAGGTSAGFPCCFPSQYDGWRDNGVRLAGSGGDYVAFVRHPLFRGLLAIVAVLCTALSPVARADVTIKQRMQMEGGGLMAMMNMSGETVTTISGDRARTESDLRMESRLMRMFGGGRTAEIVRLDEGKLYHLDLRKKTFSEMSMAEQKAAMEKSMEQMRKAQQSQKQGTSGVDESDCQWSEPTATVQRSGETQTIAGARAERTIVTATQSCKNPKTGQVCDFHLILDQWMAPDLKASDEVSSYYRNYTKKLGLDVADAPDFSQRLESMFGGYQGIWKEISEKMQQSKGYPVRSTVSLALGGPQCDSAQQAQTKQTQSSPGIGKAVGGALGGAFGRFLGGRRDKAAEEAKEAKEAKEAEKQTVAQSSGDSVLPKDTIKLMSISTELVSMSRDKVGPETFEVPAGFRKTN